jgi:hypothetical protein
MSMSVEDARADIAQGVSYLVRRAEDAEGRLTQALECGDSMAHTLLVFLEAGHITPEQAAPLWAARKQWHERKRRHFHV